MVTQGGLAQGIKALPPVAIRSGILSLNEPPLRVCLSLIGLYQRTYFSAWNDEELGFFWPYVDEHKNMATRLFGCSVLADKEEPERAGISFDLHRKRLSAFRISY